MSQNFIEKCVVEGCSVTFRRYSSFLSHLTCKHSRINFENPATFGHGSSVDLLLQTEDTDMEVSGNIVSEDTVESIPSELVIGKYYN